MARILAFAGSLRRDSYNHKIVTIAADAARQAGADVTVIRLADYPMPVFDGDLEAADGLPDGTLALQDVFAQHQALLIASPEYNSSVTAALKNTIDWVSRPGGKYQGLETVRGRSAALLAASPGALGGLRGLVHLRAILGNIGVTVLPEQLAVTKVHTLFNDAGEMTDDGQRDKIAAIGTRLAEVAARLHD